MPAESDKGNFDECICVICHMFAYDPVICSACDNSVLCNACKDDWKSKRAGIFKCPVCNVENEPRDFTRKETNFRNNIKFKCTFWIC